MTCIQNENKILCQRIEMTHKCLASKNSLIEVIILSYTF